jgi:hypothetical protein
MDKVNKFDGSRLNNLTSDLPGESAPNTPDSLIKQLIQHRDNIMNAASQHVIFSPPWVKFNDAPIISAGTSCMIQGKTGSHKSRLAELFCALMLSDGTGINTDRFCGFQKNSIGTGYVVAYIDTERNLKEDIPAVVQRVRERAGRDKLNGNDSNLFYPTSLKTVPRADRFEALKLWIIHVKEQMRANGLQEWNLAVVLDVITDIGTSFNSDIDALKLYDYIGELCERYNVAFINVLHENPGSDKARGHIGTEGQNKASTQLQIGYESGEDNQLIKVSFLKCRNAARPKPLYLQYSPEVRGLDIADTDRVEALKKDKRKKADASDVIEAVGRFFDTRADSTQKALCDQLAADLGISPRWAKEKLEEITATGTAISNATGQPCKLQVRKEGKFNLYSLAPASDKGLNFYMPIENTLP